MRFSWREQKLSRSYACRQIDRSLGAALQVVLSAIYIYTVSLSEYNIVRLKPKGHVCKETSVINCFKSEQDELAGMRNRY